MAEAPPHDEPNNVVELRPGQTPPADLNAVEALVHIRTLTEGSSHAKGEFPIDGTVDMIRVLVGKAL